MKKNDTKLEYDKILAIFSAFAVTEMGKEKWQALEPLTNRDEIELDKPVTYSSVCLVFRFFHLLLPILR